MWPAYYGRSNFKRTAQLQSTIIWLLTNPGKTMTVIAPDRHRKKEFVDFAKRYGIILDVGRQRKVGNLWRYRIRGYQIAKKS